MKYFMGPIAIILFVLGALAVSFENTTNEKEIAAVSADEYRSCIQKDDYSCVLKTLNQYPPKPSSKYFNGNLGVAAALFGEIDLAIELFQKEEREQARNSIAGAIISYLTVNENHDSLLEFRSQLKPHKLHLSALSYSQSFLRHAPTRFRDKAYSAYVDYIEKNLSELDTEASWIEIATQMGSVRKDWKRLSDFSERIPDSKLREITNTKILKYSNTERDKHRRDLIKISASGDQEKLKKSILIRIKNLDKRKGLNNRNYNIFRYFLDSSSWLEMLIERGDIKVANKFTNAVFSAVDPSGEKSCISALYGVAAHSYGEVGKRQQAVDYLNDGEKYVPDVMHDLSEDGECFQGHRAFLTGQRLALNDQADTSNFSSDHFSYLSVSFKYHGGCYTDSKTKRYVIDRIAETKSGSKKLSFSAPIRAMKTAFYFGEIPLAMSYAKMALKYDDKQRPHVMSWIKKNMVDSDSSKGWLFHHNITSC